MAKKQEKRLLTGTYIQDISIYDFEGTLDEVINSLGALKALHSQFDNLSIEVVQSYEDVFFTLVGDRLETDEEFESRIQEEKQREQRKLKRLAKTQKKAEDERKLYERLKKKFG